MMNSVGLCPKLDTVRHTHLLFTDVSHAGWMQDNPVNIQRVKPVFDFGSCLQRLKDLMF